MLDTCLQFSIAYSRFPKFVATNSGQGRHLSVTVTASNQEDQEKKTMESFLVPTYVLHDFEDGEESKPIRMILDLFNVPYEFKSVDRDDFILEDYPYYALPMLEMNNRKLGSVPSMCRHLAWRYNLSGKTAEEDAQVDMLAEKVFEARLKVKNWLDHIEHAAEHACDESCSTTSAIDYLRAEVFPLLEARLRREDNTPWLVGHAMTWADLLLACLVNPIQYHQPKSLDGFPNVFLHNQHVAHNEQLSGFLYHVRKRDFE
ncbi:unnamed protein product [Caenorhabditis auriculariae]|uniref:GST C-terminal domain-containing protein n=1 Tax=Caenorhabditis auriculariae TaxID=2777116 RepID=A0A8S1H0C4_9PELO|nr:unnamed protein product [Caenorhabditis auriculariae]